MRFSDDARRARLARRHGLHPEHRLPSPEAVAAAMVALHATEAASVHLAVAVRSNDVGVADVERALYHDRTLVKQLAMRRTLFAFPRDLLPAVWASASARVAAQQRSQLERDLVRHGVTDNPAAWLQQARLAVLDRLAPGEVLSARQLREALPELAGRTVRITDSRWA
ncbi:MAG TPA: crosslink repair DNA glycosylase YcaQ family protein, partial [Micropruina sp.]|nr:crosslink repair DNA glycosylase YcaQ family protein [Micropruina sp.]